ncbi:MAG: hypothetical protein Q9218_001730 [Villophora microphyllina]
MELITTCVSLTQIIVHPTSTPVSLNCRFLFVCRGSMDANLSLTALTSICDRARSQLQQGKIASRSFASQSLSRPRCTVGESNLHQLLQCGKLGRHATPRTLIFGPAANFGQAAGRQASGLLQRGDPHTQNDRHGQQLTTSAIARHLAYLDQRGAVAF